MLWDLLLNLGGVYTFSEKWPATCVDTLFMLPCWIQSTWRKHTPAFYHLCCICVSVRIAQCLVDEDCFNGGTCEVDAEMSRCVNCNPGYTGPLCDCEYFVHSYSIMTYFQWVQFCKICKKCFCFLQLRCPSMWMMNAEDVTTTEPACPERITPGHSACVLACGQDKTARVSLQPFHLKSRFLPSCLGKLLVHVHTIWVTPKTRPE